MFSSTYQLKLSGPEEYSLMIAEHSYFVIHNFQSSVSPLFTDGVFRYEGFLDLLRRLGNAVLFSDENEANEIQLIISLPPISYHLFWLSWRKAFRPCFHNTAISRFAGSGLGGRNLLDIRLNFTWISKKKVYLLKESKLLSFALFYTRRFLADKGIPSSTHVLL